MSFTLGNFNPGSENNGKGCIHYYQLPANEDMADVLAAGYFNQLKHLLRRGDQIACYSQKSNDFLFLGVTSSTPSGGVIVTGSDKAPAQGLLVAVGDSIVGNGISTSGTAAFNYYWHQRDPLSYFLAKYNYPFIYKSVFRGTSPAYGSNQGVGGEFSRQVVARLLSGTLSQKPKVVYWNVGTNDIKNDYTAKNVYANTMLAYEQAMRNDCVYFVCPGVFPRNNDQSVDFSAPQETQRLALNELYRDFAEKSAGSFVFLDVDSVLLDPSTGKLFSNCSYDGLHPNSKGAKRIADLLGAWYESIGGGVLPRAITPAYNATTNPYGNLWLNPTATGTGGTFGTGTSGVLPDNVRADRVDGSVTTAVFSVVSGQNINGETVNKIQGVYTSAGGGADNETIRLRPSSDLTTGVASGWYEFELEVTINGLIGAKALRSVYIDLTDKATNGDGARFHSSGYSSGVPVKDVYMDDADPNTFIFRTWPVFVKDTTGLQPYIFVDMDGTVAGTRTITFCDIVVHPVLDPQVGQKPYMPVQRIPIHANAGGQVAWTDMPAALSFFAGNYQRVIQPADLSAYTEARLVYMTSTVAMNAGAKLIARYALTPDSTAANWLDLGVSEISAVGGLTNTVYKSNWIKLAAGARGDVILSVLGSGGDGVIDPTWGSVAIEVR